MVLATGRGGTLLNNRRVAQEHLSNHGNADATPKGKLIPIYLQNTVAVYIIPSLRNEMLDYPHRQQSGPCSPTAACSIQKFKPFPGTLPLQQPRTLSVPLCSVLPCSMDSSNHPLPRVRLMGAGERGGRWMCDCCRRIQ